MSAVRSILLALALGAAAVGPSWAQAFDPNDREQDDYVRGNLMFLTYHEVGHVVLDQLLQVDQIGQRLAAETTADDISTWLLIPDSDEPGQGAEIWAAMQGWLDSANLGTAPFRSPHYPDDAERAARIACYLYGSDPDAYPDLAAAFPSTLKSVNCEEEFEALQQDIVTWLEPHLATGASTGGRLRVRYTDGGSALGAAQEYLQQSRILDQAADDLNEFIQLPRDVELVAAPCGAGAAEFRYSPSARRITACYEAVAWFMNDASAEEMQRAGGATEPRADEMGSGGARVVRRPRVRR